MNNDELILLGKKQGILEVVNWIKLNSRNNKYPQCPVCGTNISTAKWQAKLKEWECG